jgi:serine/threonine-protein kinase
VVALLLVAGVGALFVSGTRQPQVVKARLGPASAEREARAPAADPADRARRPAERGVVRFPPARARERVRRPSRRSVIDRRALLWTPERVAAAEAPGPPDLPPDVETPEYPGVPPSQVEGRIRPMVEILSVPPGARVLLDGDLLGMTPLLRSRPEEMDGGRVELRMPGYVPATGALESTPEGHLRFTAKLEPEP